MTRAGLLAVALVALTTNCSEGSAHSGTSGALLQLESPTLDLGVVGDLAPVKRSIGVKNVGDEEVIIESIDNSCHCTTGVMEKNTISPGETVQIDVNYVQDSKLGRVDESMRLRWVGSDGAQVLDIPVVGHVKKFMTVSPASIEFEILASDDKSSQYFEVASVDDQDFDVVDVHLPKFIEYIGTERLATGRHRLEFGLPDDDYSNIEFLKSEIEIETTHPVQRHIQVLGILNVRNALIVEPTAVVARVSDLREQGGFDVSVTRVDGGALSIADVDTGGAPIQASYRTDSETRQSIHFIPAAGAEQLPTMPGDFEIIVLANVGIGTDMVSLKLKILDDSI